MIVDGGQGDMDPQSAQGSNDTISITADTGLIVSEDNPITSWILYFHGGRYIYYFFQCSSQFSGWYQQWSNWFH
jgi:hypothetical protein